MGVDLSPVFINASQMSLSVISQDLKAVEISTEMAVVSFYPRSPAPQRCTARRAAVSPQASPVRMNVIKRVCESAMKRALAAVETLMRIPALSGPPVWPVRRG